MEIIKKYSVDTPIFFTSDSHFCHSNIIKFCDRPFKDVEEMNEILIDNWNKTVGPNDIIYHLGDFCFAGSAEWHSILGRLNGRIHLILGNHDEKLRTSPIYVWGLTTFISIIIHTFAILGIIHIRISCLVIFIVVLIGLAGLIQTEVNRCSHLHSMM